MCQQEVLYRCRSCIAARTTSCCNGCERHNMDRSGAHAAQPLHFIRIRSLIAERRGL